MSERDVDDERAGEVADDEPDRAPVEDGDEHHHRRDRDDDVRHARDRECGRALLGAEQVGQLLVVRLRPQADRACADEPRVVAEPDPVRDLACEDDAEHEPDRRHRHREPERCANDGSFSAGSFASK